ncbi:MAG: hypothetical protein ACXVH7_10640 [Thermoanaerobaculia bacterium]
MSSSALGSDQATTKGAVLRALLNFVQSDLTPDQYQRAIAALPDSDQAIIGQRSILASLKVSEFVLNRLTVEASRAKGEPLEEFGRRAGTAELKSAVGVYRFITMILTPAAILKRAATIWSTVHSHGTLSIVEQSEGRALMRLTDFPAEQSNCARITGWMEGLGVMTNARNTKVRHGLCMTRGDRVCEWLVTWGRN